MQWGPGCADTMHPKDRCQVTQECARDQSRSLLKSLLQVTAYLPSIKLRVFACAGVHVCECSFGGQRSEVSGEYDLSGVIPLDFVLRQDLSLACSSLIQARLGGQEIPGSLLPLPSWCWDHKHMTLCTTFYMSFEEQAEIFIHAQQAFYLIPKCQAP